MPEEKQQPASETSKTRFACPACNAEFESKEKLDEHAKAEHTK